MACERQERVGHSPIGDTQAGSLCRVGAAGLGAAVPGWEQVDPARAVFPAPGVPEAQASVSPRDSAGPRGAGLSAPSRPWCLHALRQCLCRCHPEAEMRTPQKLGVVGGGRGRSEPWTT